MLHLPLTTPPDNSPTDPHCWVWYSDPALDSERIAEERKTLRDAAAPEPPELPNDATLEDARAWREEHKATLEARAEAGNAHPVPRWLGGESMFSLSALLTVPERLRGDGPETVTIGHYWREGQTPTIWHLRILGAEQDRACSRFLSSPRWPIEVVKRGLDYIEQTVDGEVVRIDPPRDAAKLISEAWIDALDIHHPGLIDEMAADIYLLRRRAGELGKL